MSDFALHHRLKADTFHVASLPLCELLMMNDSQYPWFILVPRQMLCHEIYQLSVEDRNQLMNESCLLASILHEQFKPEKLNIATIGNLVPQLHMHHVCRYSTDASWPAPVWGKLPPQAFDPNIAKSRIIAIQNAFKLR